MTNHRSVYLINNSGHWQVQGLKRELVIAQKSRKAASASLRMAFQKAAQLRLTEKEKNKSPSYAMRISLQINKVVWSMLVDGKSFAEAEINDMIYDFDRDYKDVGIARFTTKYFVVRNCLPNVKSDMLLSAWNPPSEWGKYVVFVEFLLIPWCLWCYCDICCHAVQTFFNFI
ncbi:protein SABRE-like [Vigna umbellata]|uniref:protein SABRE-like n=1 Tax=Vigna umbellata TaxID=87088 RepID=UPI001F5F9805|nr:protein SABRE-like [Vigna umbellata]